MIRYIEFQLIAGIITIAFTYASGLLLQKINLAVRLRVWDKMMHLPTSYYDTDNVNELVTRVTTDADCAGNYFQILINIFTAVYAGIVAYQKLFSFQFQMALASLLIVPVVVGITVLYGKLTFRTGSSSKNQAGSYDGISCGTCTRASSY